MMKEMFDLCEDRFHFVEMFHALCSHEKDQLQILTRDCRDRGTSMVKFFKRKPRESINAFVGAILRP